MVDFETYVERCVVKILAPNGAVNGTGFWVLKGYCLTCLHCLTASWGNTLIRRIRSLRRKVPLRLDVEYKGRRFRAYYREDLSNPEEDIAVLEVELRGESVRCVPLGKAMLDTNARAYGYRKGFLEGYRLSGILRLGQHFTATGPVYNLETNLPEGSSITGMSGCPIYDPQRIFVIGVQHAEEMEGASISYAHPIEGIYKNWGRLKVENAKISKAFDLLRVQNHLAGSADLKNHVEVVEKKDIQGSVEQKKEFHTIVSLRWDYIEGRADSKRDLYEEIWPGLQKSKDGFYFLCILGDALSGKSTFMRRLGYDLACEGKPVLHVLEGQVRSDIWDHIAELYELVNGPIYILLDDAFDNEGAFRALKRLASEASVQSIGITVIATSLQTPATQRGLRDLRKMGLPTPSKELKLTVGDKNRILRNVGLDPLSIDSRSLERLMGTNRFYGFLAQIRELIEGTAFQPSGAIPSETLEERRLARIRSRQERVYEVYKYICFVYRHKILIPLSLIKNIGNGIYSDILDLKWRTDCIFESEVQDPGFPTLKAAHWAVAKIHWDVYLQSESPSKILKELVRAARPDDRHESVFVVHLFRICLDESNLLELRSVLTELSTEIEQLQRLVGVDQMLIWRRIYQKLHMVEDAAECLKEAKTRSPVNVPDLLVQIDLIKEENPGRALALFEEWRCKYPVNRALKVRYLTFLASLADKYPELLRTVIDQVSAWLKDLGENWDVVQAYVDIVITHAPELIPRVTDEISTKMAEQLGVVVDKAREIFVDLMEEHARDGKIDVGPISEPDKRVIERLFSEVVYGHIIAEAAAFVSFLLYVELKDDAILDRIVPSFVDQCEGKMEEIPDSVARKTGNLTDLARGVLESGAEKSALVNSLLQDIAGMSPVKHMRASFDATALSLLGE